MLKYYEQRQPEYEAIYAKPERQEDLAWLEGQLSDLVKGRSVLEIACGTGYWTRRIASFAASVHATDVSAQLAASALASCHGTNVTSGTLDAYTIPVSLEYDCVVAGFLYSHVPTEKQHPFMAGISKALKQGCRVVIFDNRYVKGSSTPVSRRELTGDTFQRRRLADGSSHEVLKNFPTADQVYSVFKKYCGSVLVQESQYFWLASGVLRG
jgi:protein-L-isoaspartate O-methyltransferase